VFARASESRVAEPELVSLERLTLELEEPSSPADPTGSEAAEPAEPVAAAAPRATRFGLGSALTQRLGKLVTAIRSLAASAMRRDKPPSRNALLSFEPIAAITELAVRGEPGPARHSHDPNAVRAALAAIAALPQEPDAAAPPAPASTADEAQASSFVPPAAASEEPTAPEPEPAPPLSVTSQAEPALEPEELLRRAMEILDGPAPDQAPAGAGAPKPAAAKPTTPVKGPV